MVPAGLAATQSLHVYHRSGLDLRLLTATLGRSHALCLGYLVGTGREDDLNVAGVGLVGVDTTVSTVCSTADFLVATTGQRGRSSKWMGRREAYRSLLDDNVLDDKVLGVKLIDRGV
jgi:hypothetical protein